MAQFTHPPFDLSQEARTNNEAADHTYLTVREAANYLRVSKSFLDKARLTGTGPPFVRLGKRILYIREDVDAWIRKQLYRSTSEYELDDKRSSRV